MSLLAELKRRNVFRVALAYAVVAWLLMQIGDTLAPALLLPEWSTRFVAFLLILGFPLALFLAWAFELTPEGIKPEKSVKREASITSVTGRRLDVLIIVLLAVAVAYFAWDKYSVRDDDHSDSQVAATSPMPERRSIAVLPFVNMSRWTRPARCGHEALGSARLCIGSGFVPADVPVQGQRLQDR